MTIFAQSTILLFSKAVDEDAD